ncbi:hypothetical protein CYLTODRAFT_487256 [Cylindrobasidium torrendii FP15055 ss-10]|uniref:Velvet domain-containing protein n=1 Tax=Cylindrobasidium torrendii FP15055 ss-10 TaxID=1314674 RepID=A0A0D7BLA9_9AGAR|nr:hypothetical protein CYLTODRAFT_487256 [Cylindrobasidium torrendii FP15055 ss-10]
MSSPFTYKHGPLKGLTVRTALRVLQSPVIGRKLSQLQRAHLTASSKMDVRPIEPPAVVQIQFFEVNPDNGSERELLNYRDYQLHDGRTLIQAQLYKVDVSKDGRSEEEQAIHVISPDNIPVYASQECTLALLHGEIFESALQLHWEDRDMMVCPFGLLSVREEGHFVLSFRAFNIGTSATTEAQGPISAMAWSEKFTIVASKKATALGTSTPLTLALSDITSRITARSTLRATRSKTRKRPADEDDARDDEDEDDQNVSTSDGG